MVSFGEGLTDMREQMFSISWYHLKAGKLTYEKIEASTKVRLAKFVKRRTKLLYDNPEVAGIWPMALNDRANAWGILIEALALGADFELIHARAIHWRCGVTDAHRFADIAGFDLWSAPKMTQVGSEADSAPLRMKAGVRGIVGEGPTYLHAMADLCRKLGYTGNRLVEDSFVKRVKG